MGCFHNRKKLDAEFQKELDSQNRHINNLIRDFEELGAIYISNNENFNPIDHNQVPEDQFLCPICQRLIPEIINIHTDNKKIEFKCQKCSEREFLSFFYEKELLNSQYKYLNEKCNYCKNNAQNNRDVFSYCYDCQINFCKNCESEHKTKTTEHNHIIKVSEKSNFCLKHFNEKFTKFCLDCGENICNESNEHENHRKTDLSKQNSKYLHYKGIIVKKNKELMAIINFNELILNKNINNYFYLTSLVNIGKSFYRENYRDSNDLKLIFDDYENKNNNSENIIDKLKNKDIEITRNEENLLLNQKNIDNQSFELISQIRFNQLKYIDLSENMLSNIEFLNNISLPFLEFLNLSHNKIKDIGPIGDIKSKKLDSIYFHDNEIEEIGVFLNDIKFPSLKILRLEKNKINERSFKELRKIYINIITDREIEIMKTECGINEESNIIDLSNKIGGDLLLKKMFIIITYKSKNKINKLNLSNNKIDNPSLLNRIQLNKMTDLDLSMNNIKNLNFLKEMKAENLKNLFLNNNKINDLSPLINIAKKFKHLQIISIHSNNFDPNQPRNLEIIESIRKINSNIRMQINP